MKVVCYISFCIFAILTLALGMALFDIVALNDNLKGIFGIIDIISLAIFFKAFIRTYKYTHRD